MTTFLNGAAAESAIKKMLCAASVVRIAVAYWGAGATKRLGLRTLPSKDIIVICDLLSGCCNPSEVATLQRVLGKSRVKTCDKLHSKVWFTDKDVLVGSSNASTNGFGYEGDTASGLIEGNIHTDDPQTRRAVQEWLEKQVFPRSRVITEQDLAVAEKRYKTRRAAIPIHAASVLDKLRNNSPDLSDQNIFVWVYNQKDHDPWALKAIQEERGERQMKDLNGWDMNRNAKTPPAGSLILDFHYENNRAQFTGLWEVLTDNPIRVQREGKLLLAKPQKVVMGAPLGKKTEWEKAAARAAASSRASAWEGQIAKFAQFLSD